MDSHESLFHFLGTSAAMIALRFIFPAVFLRRIFSRIGPPSDVGPACDHVMKLLFHCSLFVMGVWILSSEEWFTFSPGTALWYGFPNIPMSSGVHVYYAFQVGFYVSSTVFTVILEERRRDHWVMVTHHIVSVTLVLSSYSQRVHRLGCIVLITRELSDILLHAAKVALYLGSPFFANVLFATLMATWPLLRLLYHPLVVLRSSYVDVWNACSQYYDEYFWTYYLLNFALLFLVPVDWYYFLIGMKVTINRLKGKPLADIRQLPKKKE
eukprot:NODE_3241_length_1017_cov_30.912190_g2979_i0.p1 GENE.NODE_3241_length_1017_cov_30.912190_g2979_i0~~NODE_3241_length_1017_cov_30.912190_g2979_i0.p1  ORF type:complete len:268 (+),score=50.56 NODE_3241_length_1017_cov_30.912190_g2979_i0:1-804(+)